MEWLSKWLQSVLPNYESWHDYVVVMGPPKHYGPPALKDHYERGFTCCYEVYVQGDHANDRWPTHGVVVMQDCVKLFNMQGLVAEQAITNYGNDQ
jgi:hypothetical protein